MRHLIGVAALAWPMLVTAQPQPSARVPVDSGAAIRVLLRSTVQLEGELVRQTPDSVTIRREILDTTADTSIALAHIWSVDARVRRHTLGSALKGMGLGLLAGAAVGTAVFAKVSGDCRGEECQRAGFAIPVYAILGGASGLVVGGIRKGEGWGVVWLGYEHVKPQTPTARQIILRKRLCLAPVCLPRERQ